MFIVVYSQVQCSVHLVLQNVGRDSVVGITSRYGLDGPGITQPPIQWIPGLLPGDKAAGAWPYHPPHLAPKFKKE